MFNHGGASAARRAAGAKPDTYRNWKPVHLFFHGYRQRQNCSRAHGFIGIRSWTTWRPHAHGEQAALFHCLDAEDRVLSEDRWKDKFMRTRITCNRQKGIEEDFKSFKTPFILTCDHAPSSLHSRRGESFFIFPFPSSPSSSKKKKKKRVIAGYIYMVSGTRDRGNFIERLYGKKLSLLAETKLTLLKYS